MQGEKTEMQTEIQTEVKQLKPFDRPQRNKTPC